jgi:hypothetical protein
MVLTSECSDASSAEPEGSDYRGDVPLRQHGLRRPDRNIDQV